MRQAYASEAGREITYSSRLWEKLARFSAGRKSRQRLLCFVEVAEHAWLLDPDAETLEVYELRHGQWAQLAAYGTDQTPAAAPFEGAAFRLADLWS